MNERELIEKIEALPAENYKYRPYIDKKVVLALVRQLDEPEKVKVSEEEAKFLKTFDFNCKSDVTAALYNISRTGYGYYLTDNNGTELKGLSEEFRNIENRKRLIRAILFGYEVEKEKRYYIRLKIDDENYNYLNYIKHLSAWCLAGIKKDKKFRTEHTRKQLEDAGFGEVFNSTLFEVEEVE